MFRSAHHNAQYFASHAPITGDRRHLQELMDMPTGNWTHRTCPPPPTPQRMNWRYPPNAQLPFTSLPAEIRLLIWELALPEVTKPLFFYNRGDKARRKPTRFRDDIVTTPGGAELPPLRYPMRELQHERLGGVDLPMPLLSVNREARSVAKKWCERHGFTRVRNLERTLEEQTGTKSQVAHHKRSFDPKSDVYYTKQGDLESRWDLETIDERFIEIIAIHLSSIDEPPWRTRRRRLTHPMTDWCVDIRRSFPRLREILIVRGPEPKWEPIGMGSAWHRRPWWGVRPMVDLDGVVWRHEGVKSACEEVLQESIDKKITEKIRAFGEVLHQAGDGKHRLCIKLVEVVEMT